MAESVAVIIIWIPSVITIVNGLYALCWPARFVNASWSTKRGLTPMRPDEPPDVGLIRGFGVAFLFGGLVWLVIAIEITWKFVTTSN